MNLSALLRQIDVVSELNSVGGTSANAGGAGKIHSLEELEARLRPHHSQPMPQPDHDLSAFKRLVSIKN